MHDATGLQNDFNSGNEFFIISKIIINNLDNSDLKKRIEIFVLYKQLL